MVIYSRFRFKGTRKAEKRMLGHRYNTSEEGNKAVISWCLYDVGNSAFATTIIAAILPIYFREVSASTLPGNLPTAYWGYASAIALFISALIAPFVGTMADINQNKKGILSVFTITGAAATACLYFMGPGTWRGTLFLMIIGTVAFSASLICYDSLLPHIVPTDRLDNTSAMGYAMGYLGGGILLAFNFAIISILPGTLGARLSFLSVALWWTVFTVPLVLFVPEPHVAMATTGKRSNMIFSTLKRLKTTFSEIRRYRELFKFLLAFWIYNDGIGTIIRMAAIYGSQIGIGMKSLVGALLLTQFIAVPFSIIFGKLAQEAGSKKALHIALLCYTCIAIGAVFLAREWHFWCLAATVGMVQGGAQSISRSLYAGMVPKGRSGEFFSFYDISSKFAGIAGPAIFAFITQTTGSSRIAIAVLSFSFIIGMAILGKVDTAEGARIARLPEEGQAHSRNM